MIALCLMSFSRVKSTFIIIRIFHRKKNEADSSGLHEKMNPGLYTLLCLQVAESGDVPTSGRVACIDQMSFC